MIAGSSLVVKTTPRTQPSNSTGSLDRDSLLTKEQLAQHLSVPSTRMVDELMRARKIPFVKLGHRTVRFDLARVLEALSRLEVKAVGDVTPTRK